MVSKKWNFVGQILLESFNPNSTRQGQSWPVDIIKSKNNYIVFLFFINSISAETCQSFWTSYRKKMVFWCTFYRFMCKKIFHLLILNCFSSQPKARELSDVMRSVVLAQCQFTFWSIPGPVSKQSAACGRLSVGIILSDSFYVGQYGCTFWNNSSKKLQFCSALSHTSHAPQDVCLNLNFFSGVPPHGPESDV